MAWLVARTPSLGSNFIVRKDGLKINFGAKNTYHVLKGDRIQICTPGGGVWKNQDDESPPG